MLKTNPFPKKLIRIIKLKSANCSNKISQKNRKHKTYELQYLNTPLMSTSLQAALTMGTFTSGGPKPTKQTIPPDLVAWNSAKCIIVYRSNECLS